MYRFRVTDSASPYCKSTAAKFLMPQKAETSSETREQTPELPFNRCRGPVCDTNISSTLAYCAEVVSSGTNEIKINVK